MPSGLAIDYGSPSGALLDWYEPASPVDCCVILVHPGAWHNDAGDRDVYKTTYSVIDDLNASGITAITIDYTNEDIEAQVADVLLAVDWVRANLGYFKIVLWGDSAGAHLCLLASRRGNAKGVFGVLASSAAVELLGSVVDSVGMTYMKTVVGAAPNDEPDRWRRLSPIRMTRKLASLPCIYAFVDWSEDSVVPTEQHGTRMANLLREDGGAVLNLVVPGTDHGHAPEGTDVGTALVLALAAA